MRPRKHHRAIHYEPGPRAWSGQATLCGLPHESLWVLRMMTEISGSGEPWLAGDLCRGCVGIHRARMRIHEIHYDTGRCKR